MTRGKRVVPSSGPMGRRISTSAGEQQAGSGSSAQAGPTSGHYRKAPSRGKPWIHARSKGNRVRDVARQGAKRRGMVVAALVAVFGVLAVSASGQGEGATWRVTI